MFIYKIIVVIELFLIYPLVFLNIRFGTESCSEKRLIVGTILGTVAAAGICQNVNADAVAFVFPAKSLRTGDQIIEFFMRCIQDGDGILTGEDRIILIIKIWVHDVTFLVKFL